MILPRKGTTLYSNSPVFWANLAQTPIESWTCNHIPHTSFNMLPTQMSCCRRCLLTTVALAHRRSHQSIHLSLFSLFSVFPRTWPQIFHARPSSPGEGGLGFRGEGMATNRVTACLRACADDRAAMMGGRTVAGVELCCSLNAVWWCFSYFALCTDTNHTVKN